MRFILFFIFVAVPLTELALLIKLGEIVGIIPTVLIVITTAMLGVTLLRLQGLTVLANARAATDAGRVPVDSVVDGVLLLLAGAFLLTPGLLTDSVGFLLLIPNLRRAIAHWAFEKLKQMGTFDVFTFPPGGPGGPAGGPRRGPQQPEPTGPTIEGEFSSIEKPDEPSSKGEKASSAGSSGDGDGKSPWRR
jgi:UPF0716 protein FxsA